MAAGLDYSSGPIPPAAILAAGYSTVWRYIDDPAESFGTKHICPDEYAALIAGGVDVQLVFEVKATDFIGGFLEGVINATRAHAGAQWVGYDGLIWFTVDTHLTAAQIPIALDYLQGCEHVAGKIGVYGFPELIQAAQTAGVGVAYWQCGHHPAAGSGVHVWQRNDGTVTVGGVECDVDLILLPLPDGDEMTPEQVSMLTAVYQYVSGSAEVVPQGTLWPGWPTWPGGSGTPLTATDYLRQNNVDVETLKTEVAAIKATLDSLSVGQSGDLGNLSDQDVQRVADAVTTALAAKLTGAPSV